MWKQPVAYGLVVVATVGASVWSANEAVDRSNQNTQAEIQRFALGLAIRARDATVTGCNRGREDRQDAIRGWTTALQARRATARNPDVDEQERLTAAAAAAVYRQVIAGYRSRIVDCSNAFPAPRIPK